MQVLVKNPFAPLLKVPGTFPSFWSPECLMMDQDFSFGKAVELSLVLSYSPFLTLDPKIAFLLSMADQKKTYARGIGLLGLVGLHFYTRQEILRDQDGKQLDRYVKEYLPASPFKDALDIEQVVVFDESIIDRDLWDKLPVGGTYVMGFTQGKFNSNGVSFEAFGKLWPYGEANEFGWQFDEDNWGLGHFKFNKIRKLS